MATITTLANKVGADLPVRHGDNSELGYTVWREVDLAAAATAKGSALAASDIIEVLRLPKDTQILAVAVKKSAASAGTATDVTLNVGITGVDVDQYVAAWDYDAAAVGSYATPADGSTPNTIVATSDTIDVAIASMTGTLTAGKIVVSAFVRDLSTRSRGAIAQLKS